MYNVTRLLDVAEPERGRVLATVRDAASQARGANAASSNRRCLVPATAATSSSTCDSTTGLEWHSVAAHFH